MGKTQIIKVYRNKKLIALFEEPSITKEDAIGRAIDDYSYAKWGQPGPLTDKQMDDWDSFNEGNFTAKIITE